MEADTGPSENSSTEFLGFTRLCDRWKALELHLIRLLNLDQPPCPLLDDWGNFGTHLPPIVLTSIITSAQCLAHERQGRVIIAINYLLIIIITVSNNNYCY